MRRERIGFAICFRKIAAALGLAAAALVIGCALTPLPRALERSTPATLILMDRNGRELAELPSPDARSQQPISLGEMGSWLPAITVALEDHRFYQHRGVDWHSAAGSAWRNLRARRIVSGASTITQQVIKLASARRGRGWTSKLYEAVAATKLERRWSKDRILAEYLNRCQYGNRMVGPEAASRWYFGKPARDLTLAEAVFLAGLPQAPTQYNPWRNPSRALGRYLRSVRMLAERNALTSDQAERLAAAPPTVGRFLPARNAPHFVEAALRQSPGMTGAVRTTLDLDLQRTVEQFVRAHLRSLNRNDITGAAVVVLQNANGAVRALVGSPDFSVSEINGALTPRSCGSTLKPFVYLRGVEDRALTAATLLPDTPDAIRDAYADYDPQDYNRRYLGPVRVREALACSLNVPAVVALSRVGARKTFFDLQRWGFQFPRGLDDYGAGFILGNAEVSPLDLAAAYAGLARGGAAVRPTCLPYLHKYGDRIASPEAAAVIADILCDNDARARAFGLHSPLETGARVAAKTGTSSGFRDAWTVGFTRDHTVAVWVGNPDGRPMRETLAIRAAAPLWSAIIGHLLKADAPVDSPVESGTLVKRRICRMTGLLPAALSPGVMDEWFLPGTEPVADASAWFGKGEGNALRLVLPAEYAAWCRSPFNHLGAIHPSDQRLTITQPPDRATFAIDAALPRRQQMLEFACTGGVARDVRWYVNNQEIAPQPDGRIFWLLQPGEWEVSVRTANESARAVIHVE